MMMGSNSFLRLTELDIKMAEAEATTPAAAAASGHDRMAVGSGIPYFLLAEEP